MSLADLTKNLRAEVHSECHPKPKARVHSVEWAKIMSGEPVEINPTLGFGYKIMTVDEWSARWKPNEAFQECLNCGSKNTKEHHFTQTWCRNKKKWESECLCLDCHMFSWRNYADPDFKTPEEYDKERWTEMVKGERAKTTATVAVN